MLMFILGILTMSVLATIGFGFSDSGKENIGAWFNGPIFWILFILISLYNLLKKVYRYIFFCSYLVKEDGTKWYCNNLKWYYDIIWHSPEFSTNNSRPKVTRKFCKGLPKIDKKEYECIKCNFEEG